MYQGLHLSQRMSLVQVLSPQMQQSLALLQAPCLELQAMVAHELQQNPLLEELAQPELTQQEKDEGKVDKEAVAADPSEPPADVTYDPAQEKPASEPVDDFQAEFQQLAQADQEWRDNFARTNAPMRQQVDEDERRQFRLDSLVADTSLQETLIEQMQLSELSDPEQQIAQLIIGNIDDRGFLQSSLEELSSLTSVPQNQLIHILEVIQSFHPVGVGARNLQECLMLQLERQGKAESIEYRIVRDCMESLGKRRIPDIARKLGASIDDVQEAFGRIAHLNPRPGHALMPAESQYIVPEVFVTRVGDEFTVSTSNDHVPHLRISSVYRDLMAQADSSPEVREYIREKIRAGKFLIKSLQQRQQTILNIATEIVHRQREFMDKGVAHLKPLTMIQVAVVVGVHETTVSRGVSGKYMQTPQGIFEMKYFFTSGFQTPGGGNVSNTSVKDMINDMVRNEDTTKPISDEEIAKLVGLQGIHIARRTVAKYRAELSLLPSHLRRVY